MDEVFKVFIQEAREQLAAMEDGLLRMEQREQTGSDDDLLDAIFRAAHTIKGAAGVVELPAIEHFTHVLESVLDQLRSGALRVDTRIIDLLLQCCDHLHAQLGLLESGGSTEDAAHAPAGGQLVHALQSLGNPVPEGESHDTWHISVQFGPDMLRAGMDPLAFLRYLQQLGEITRLTTRLDALPEIERFEAHRCYLGFDVTLRTGADKHEIENVFAFCRDECELSITPPQGRVGDYLQSIEALPEEPMRIGEMLIRAGALTSTELDAGLRQQADQSRQTGGTSTPAPLGQILVAKKAVAPEVVEAAATRQKRIRELGGDARVVRVHADKLDQLIDLIGELVIAGASANLLAHQNADTRLIEANAAVSRLVEGIRDATLQLRMVQIGDTFNRFRRIVRDLSHELGKSIELHVVGAETELDKAVVERLADPLMHLVRNAIDHGIEPAAVRAAAGKPEQGRLELRACHDSGNVVIEITDDGGGISAERILARAVQRGLVQADQNLTEREILNLIFEPGFSTSETVSKLSGRGVGMDVVKRSIEALRGSIEVQTWPGRGSRFTLRLPLTLAIIDGFLTTVAEAAYVVPLNAVVECLELRADDTRGHMLNLRGEVLPFIRLRELFGIDAEPAARENVVVVRAGAIKAGIVVDQLQGQFQTVIKPLGRLFRNVRGIGGSTILGSGTVALILDVPALTQLAVQREMAAFADSRHTPDSPPATTQPTHAWQ